MSIELAQKIEQIKNRMAITKPAKDDIVDNLSEDCIQENPEGLDTQDNLFIDLPIISRDEDECSIYKYREPIISGCLNRGEIAFLAAPSKGRKTFTMLDLAVSCSCGIPWLGYQTSQCNVLFVNFELQPDILRDRRRKIEDAHLVKADRLYVANMRQMAMSCSMDRLKNSIISSCRKYDISLLILDPIYLMFLAEGGDENTVKDVGKFLVNVKDVCEKANVAVMYSHHYTKGDSSTKSVIDRAAGSGVHARLCDALFTMTPAPSGNPYDSDETDTSKDVYIAIQAKNRNFKDRDPIVCKWDHPVWTAVSTPTAKEFLAKPEPKSRRKAKDGDE